MTRALSLDLRERVVSSIAAAWHRGARMASNRRSTQSSMMSRIISPEMPPPDMATQAMISRSWVSMAKATRTTSPFQQGISKPSGKRPPSTALRLEVLIG